MGIKGDLVKHINRFKLIAEKDVLRAFNFAGHHTRDIKNALTSLYWEGLIDRDFRAKGIYYMPKVDRLPPTYHGEPHRLTLNFQLHYPDGVLVLPVSYKDHQRMDAGCWVRPDGLLRLSGQVLQDMLDACMIYGYAAVECVAVGYDVEVH